MKKRKFFNPVINDTATFLETCEETNGKHSLIQIELYKSNGPPLHYHNAFSEKFEVVEGKLYLRVGKQKHILKPGEQMIVAPGAPHKFYNLTNEKVKFKITFEPGHTGMENFIKIFYGLALDGLTDKKGKPKIFSHLAVALTISDSNAPGWLSLLSPIIRSVAKRAKKNGTEKWLLDRYCN